MLRTFLVLALFAAPTSALADREPTLEERARIEAALRAEGFTRWKDIESDDDGWEVEDAVAADGREYELKLNNAFAIVEREADDTPQNTGSTPRN